MYTLLPWGIASTWQPGQQLWVAGSLRFYVLSGNADATGS